MILFHIRAFARDMCRGVMMLSQSLVSRLERFYVVCVVEEIWTTKTARKKQLANVKRMKTRGIKFPKFSLKKFFPFFLFLFAIWVTHARLVSGRIFFSTSLLCFCLLCDENNKSFLQHTAARGEKSSVIFMR